MSLKSALKRGLFRLLGKDPEAVVVSFLTGDAQRSAAMLREVTQLIPDRRHFAVSLTEVPAIAGVEPLILDSATAGGLWLQLRRRFRPYRIGLAPILLDDANHSDLRRAACALAPAKLLAFNSRGERHHLQPQTWLASLLFARGVPLDRIWLRPRWLVPWKKDRTVAAPGSTIINGRPRSPLRPRVAILSPYLPWPLAHGGAVRIFNLLRETAREFDVYLFAFVESDEPPGLGPLPGLCAKIVTVPKPRYREPRWSSLRPPEVNEYRSPEMERLLTEIRRNEDIRLTQVEYTQLASYAGHVLVEHDVTFDLYGQVSRRKQTTGARWDFWRWQRYERAAVRRFPRVVVMSEKDRELLQAPGARVIANGVDLDRYRPAPEPDGQRLLFIGSFRHFPNIVAFRYLIEQIYPAAKDLVPNLELTVVSGPDPQIHWRSFAGTPAPPSPPGVRMLEFVSDVRPLYDETNIVVVPTLESAGTNIKVLEAMAMERAVVSTPSGVAGLGLEHGRNVWVADGPAGFAAGIRILAENPPLRRQMATRARQTAQDRFDWRSLGLQQRQMIREFTGPGLLIRDADPGDIESIARIQSAAPEAAQWPPESYLFQDAPAPGAAERQPSTQPRPASGHPEDPAGLETGVAPDPTPRTAASQPAGSHPEDPARPEAGVAPDPTARTAASQSAGGHPEDPAGPETGGTHDPTPRTAATLPASSGPSRLQPAGRCLVADLGGEVLGFLAIRKVTADEQEILTLATAPAHRKQGVGRLLVEAALDGLEGRCFLEVRESNIAAQSLYESLGFERLGSRPEYYKNPNEPAIVMGFQSC